VLKPLLVDMDITVSSEMQAFSLSGTMKSFRMCRREHRGDPKHQRSADTSIACFPAAGTRRAMPISYGEVRRRQRLDQLNCSFRFISGCRPMLEVR
jgi:hypothetical protein